MRARPASGRQVDAVDTEPAHLLPGARAGQRPANPFHTHEFTSTELLSLISSAGFTDLQLTGLRPADRLIALDERYRASGGFVAAQLAGPPTRWPAELRAEVAATTAADFVLDTAEPDASLDLIVLARWA